MFCIIVDGMIYLYAGLGMAMILPILVGLQALVSLSERQAEELRVNVGQNPAVLANRTTDFVIVAEMGKEKCYIRINSKEKCPRSLSGD